MIYCINTIANAVPTAPRNAMSIGYIELYSARCSDYATRKAAKSTGNFSFGPREISAYGRAYQAESETCASSSVRSSRSRER